jgi:hypothetical protein
MGAITETRGGMEEVARVIVALGVRMRAFGGVVQ